MIVELRSVILAYLMGDIVTHHLKLTELANEHVLPAKA